MAERERLQKLMSQAGIASRRDAEAYVVAGRVMINGQVARLGDRADLSVDDVRIDGEPLQAQTHFTYIMVNKPMQVVTAVTRQYQEKRQTVRDLVNIPGRLFPVGRLDADSEGLVLMTDDGDMAERMTHPRFEHAKIYDVLIRGDLTREQLAMWERGVVLDDGLTLPAEVKVTEREPGSTRLRITMREGRKRQIRRIAVMLGHPVIRLLRIQIGPILLGNLRPGEWRELTKDEIDALKREAGTSARRVRQRSRSPARASSRPVGSDESGEPREYRESSRSTARNAAPVRSNDSARGESRSARPERAPRPSPAADDRVERDDFAPPREPNTADSGTPGVFRSNPNRPSRRPNKHERPFEGDAPESRSDARPEGRSGSRPDTRGGSRPATSAGRTVRQGTRRTGRTEGSASSEETVERAPFKRPVAPPSRAKSKPPSRYPESGDKRGSPAASKPSRSARAANPDKPDRGGRPDRAESPEKAGSSERSERPDRVERALRNARPGQPLNRAARRAAGLPNPEPGAPVEGADPTAAVPRKPRKRPESASRSQKPSKSPHSGSRSQGGRPKKSSSQSGPKSTGASGKSGSSPASKSRPKSGAKSDKSDSEK
jgi:pseudouridine synthase